MKSGRSERKVDERKKKSVIFDKDAIEIIEAYRRGHEEIPSFSTAVNALVLMSADLVGEWLEEATRKGANDE